MRYVSCRSQSLTDIPPLLDRSHQLQLQLQQTHLSPTSLQSTQHGRKTLPIVDASSKPAADSSTTSPTPPISIQHGETTHVFTHDEYHLATLGYKQEFYRSLGFFESWAATFTSMNFVSGIPVLFG